MKLSDFGQLFTTFKVTAFRLETRDRYLVDDESMDFECFLNGEYFSNRKNADWVRVVKAAVEAGKKMGRVHVMPRVLTSYLRYEIEWGYVFSASAGEDIRLLLTDDVDTLSNTLVDHDFWLFDDCTCVWMEYDDDGRFIGVQEESDDNVVRECSRLQGELLEKSITLQTYLKHVRRSWS